MLESPPSSWLFRMSEILTLKNVSKNFPGVKALDNVSLTFHSGEVHSICGENGAGKSTLMKILSGVYQCDTGCICIDGKPVEIRNPLDAHQYGISIIFQEFNLVDQLSISENIYLGRLGKGSCINWKEINAAAEGLMKHVGCNLFPTTLVKNLSVAEKQMVEIAKALSYESRIIIMDEPSSALTSNEVEKLLEIIQELKKKGISIIYISHKLEEVLQISDRITVMRDGTVVSSQEATNIDQNSIVEQMVGRPISQEFPKRSQYEYEGKEKVLEVENLCSDTTFENISFDLYKGEVVGLAGLVGAGRTEIVRAIFGADAYNRGSIKIKGETATIKAPKDSIAHGIALLTEDRKKQGLHLDLSVSLNISCANLAGISPRGLIIHNEEETNSQEYVEKLAIKTPSLKQRVVNLSGGNQQKVVLAKWLYANSDIIILDEPTRGIDIGAKMEIYNLINDLISKGKSIIMISSELPELLGMCDRIIVLNEGRITAEIIGKDIVADKIMHAMLGKEEMV